MDILPYSLGVDTTDTFEIWRRKTNGVITKLTTGFLGDNPDTGYPTWTSDGDFTINGSGRLNAKDIYCRNIYSGVGTSTGDSVIELGNGRTGTGSAILDFHSSVSSNYDARIWKEADANGIFNIVNTGTGAVKFTQGNGTGNFSFNHSGNDRLVIGNAAVTVGTAGIPIPLTVNGDIIGTAKLQNAKVIIDGSDIYEYATNALTTLSINRLGYAGLSTQFRDTIIYDGKASELAIFNGSTREVTIGKTATTSSLNVIGSITGTSLSAGTGAISGGALTCTTITATGNITASSSTISGLTLSAGTGGITSGGNITASNSQISGNTLRTASSLTFGTDVGASPQNGDLIRIERFDFSSEVTQLRATIGDDANTNDSFLIGINTTGLPAGWVEKFRVTSGGNVTTAGFIKAGGDIVAYNSSDSRLKENVKVIPDALSKVSQLSGVTFDWNDQQTLYSGNDVGVIAQEVEAVLPQIVITREDGYKAVKYEKLVALLIESIKELKVSNEQLQSRIYSLEQHVNN